MKKLSSQKINRNSHWLVLFIGLLFSYLGFYVTIDLENRTIKAEQQDITDLAIDALNKELAVSLNIISSIRSFYLASTFVSRSEFKLFTEAELKAHPSIQALEWIPHVSDELREDFRLKAVRDGLLSYDITERDAEGKLVPAKQRADYYPVYYIEPLQGNEAALGFDLASSEKRLTMLKQARRSRQIQATGSITLVQDTSRQKVFLMVEPTFSSAANDPDKLKAPFNGFTLGVIKISDLFESAVKPIKTIPDSLLLELADITDSQNIELLHSSQLSSEMTPLADKAWTVSKVIHFANRDWQLSSIATDAFLNSHASITRWLVLLTGCTLTLLLSGYLRTLIRREAEIQRLVTQRTRELQSSEKMSRAIIDTAVDSVITIDESGSISLFSPAAEKLFGYRSEEVIGKNVKMLMPEPYQSEHDGYLQHHKQTGEKRIIGIGREVRGLRKDGSTFPMNLSVGKAQVNGDTIYVGTVTNLTVLKNKEQELLNFSDRLDMAAKAGKIGVWDYDVVSESLNWDDRMFEIYGVTRESSPDASEVWRKAINPDDQEHADAEILAALKGGKNFEFEFGIHWPNGEQRFIQASGVVVFDDKGYGYRLIGINMDITESKRSEENMRLAKQAAEEANRQKSAFLNVMSHELRTPLTVILGYLPLLRNREKMLPAEAVAKVAEDMDISGQHLLEMINDLLDISKIEAGQLNLSIEDIKSQPLIEEMLRKFDNQAQQKGIELLSTSEDFSFQVDPRRLRQILINLIGNALKFTPHGSITITTKYNKNFVTFSITDTGIGIPESEQPFVFDTFRQVDDSSTRNAGGSGLGLAITKRLVELHGGTIEVESKPGSGTTFTFTIKQ